MNILKGMKKIEETFLVMSMAIILLLIFSQALFRYFFGSGLVWGEELARFVHVAQVWIGASFIVKKGGHIRITFFRNLFSNQIKKYLDILSTFLFFCLMVFIAYEGTFFVLQLIESSQTSPSMGIKMGIPYAVIPIGGLLMVVRLIGQFKDILKGDLLEE